MLNHINFYGYSLSRLELIAQDLGVSVEEFVDIVFNNYADKLEASAAGSKFYIMLAEPKNGYPVKKNNAYKTSGKVLGELKLSNIEPQLVREMAKYFEETSMVSLPVYLLAKLDGTELFAAQAYAKTQSEKLGVDAPVRQNFALSEQYGSGLQRLKDYSANKADKSIDRLIDEAAIFARLHFALEGKLIGCYGLALFLVSENVISSTSFFE